MCNLMLNMLTTDEESHVVQVSQETRVRRLVSEQGGGDFADVQGLFSILASK